MRSWLWASTNTWWERLPLPFKLLIGFAGITGSKSRGMEMLRDDGNRGPVTNIEARTVMALFLRREAKYQEAVQVVHSLKSQYPRDYLFCLEEANLRKDSGEGMGAVAAYREILTAAAKPGYFASARLELTYFGLGDALRGQRHYAEAAQAYEETALAKAVSPELKVRSFLAAGQCRDLNGERQASVEGLSGLHRRRAADLPRGYGAKNTCGILTRALRSTRVFRFGGASTVSGCGLQAVPFRVA